MDNKDLYELMDDLRELGLGEDKVYFQLYKSTGLIPYGKIKFPTVNNISGEPKMNNIMDSLIRKNYILEMDPDMKGDSYYINSVKYFIMDLIREALAFKKTDDIYADIIKFTKRLVVHSFSVGKIDLIIYGKVKFSSK